MKVLPSPPTEEVIVIIFLCLSAAKYCILVLNDLNDSAMIDYAVESMEILMATSCDACIHGKGSHARDNTCKRFRRAELEKKARQRRKREAAGAIGSAPPPTGKGRHVPAVVRVYGGPHKEGIKVICIFSPFCRIITLAAPRPNDAVAKKSSILVLV